MSDITRSAIMELNENQSTRLKSALFGDASGKIKTWALMSAENPMNTSLSAQENNKRTEELKRQLKAMNIVYTPVKGVYDGKKESSFMLFNLRFKDAEGLAKIFGQESFFFAETKKPEGDDRSTTAHIRYFATKNGGETYEQLDEGETVSTLKDATNYFSQHGDFQFSIDMSVFESFPEVYNEVALENSLNESNTSKGATLRRYYAYRKPVE